MSVYQILYMDRVPDSAVCNEAVKLAVKRHFSGLKGFVNGVLRTISREKENLTFDTPSLRYSIPEWMYAMWEKEFGKEKAEKIAASFLEDKPTWVRCNLHRADRESILASKLGLKPQFFRRQRAVQPRFDTRADWEILCGLASRLGLDKLAFSRIEDIWNYQLEGTGLGIEAFDATGFVPLASAPRWKTLAETTLPTPSGKIEARSRLWAASGHDTLPPYTAPERPAAPDQFRVIPGRAALHTQASTTNNPLLSELAPTNTLWIHTERAQALGIADGDWVEVCTATGPVGRLRAKVTTGIHPEAVFMLHGFGRKTPQETRAFGKGVADEACMISGLEHGDPLGGGLALQKHFVTIRKAEETN